MRRAGLLALTLAVALLGASAVAATDASDAGADRASTADLAPPAAVKSAPEAAVAAAIKAADAATVTAPITPALEASKPAAPEAHAGASAEGVPVRIGDRRVFILRADRAGQSADARARKTSQILEQLIDEGKVEEVRVQAERDLLVVYSGKTPIIQLGPEDAAASGDATLAVHADAVAANVRVALANEVKRRTTANLVFSFSLVVLSGLIAFLLLRALSGVARGIATSLEESKRVPGFRVGSVELLTPAAVKVAASMTLSVLRPVTQVTLSYFWVVFALSLFPATAAFGQRVSGFVLTPLTTLVARLGSTLPMLAILAIGVFATAMTLRFVRVFFDGIASGELHFGGLPADLAMPLSILTRIGVVATALLVAAPLLTGADQGALPVAGIALLATFVLAAAPAMAGGAVGAMLLLGRRLKLGEYVEIGASAGILRRVTFFELYLEDRAGNELRVPHLLTIIHPLRLLGDAPATRWEVTVDSKLPQGRVRKTLADAVRRQGHAVHVELVEIDATTARYLILGAAQPGEDDLASAIADALTREGLQFGRIRKVEP